jgi:hypothetical protein
MTAPSKVRFVEQSMFPDVKPDKPVGPILPSVFVGSNADLMLAIAPYYLTGSVVDVTFGEGKWWERFQPHPFTAHDLHKVDGVDFRSLPESGASFDTVCFDPPYVLSGGASSAALGGHFHDAYGIGQANTGLTPGTAAGDQALRDLIVDGLKECCRVASSYVLVKCMEFAQGGQFHDIPQLVTTRALELGWLKHDQIVHHTGSGPGGHNIFDPKRARRHHSYLIVFAKGRC